VCVDIANGEEVRLNGGNSFIVLLCNTTAPGNGYRDFG
jgi:hypothetical protein